MDHSWRSGPTGGSNPCPVCFNSHFPWCPPHYSAPLPPPHRQFAPPPLPPHNPYAPPPLPQNPYAPPPPPPPYNPFIDHQNPPSRPPPPPQDIYPSNFTTDYYGNTSKHVISQHDNHGVKRMRFDYATSEDDRRLKMIRDHGHLAATHSFSDRNYIEASRVNNIPQRFAQPLSAHNGPSFYAKHHVYEVNGIRGVEGHMNYQGPQKISTYDRGNLSTETGNKFLQFPAMQQHVVDSEPVYYDLSNCRDKVRPGQGFNGQPPLPNLPPPPLTIEPPLYHISGSVKLDPNSRGYPPEESQATPVPSSKTFTGANEEFQHKNLSSLKPKIIDASHILKHPHRANRPDHIVVILRGLPGSGKSYLAKFLRDLEVENGGSAPRIHSMDDYFMTEVEKVEDVEGSRSSGSARGKKSTTKVMEYCYEPEMEEAYRTSMLKAFKKTLDEGAFPFVIVDDRNLRVADFAQFWASAKRSGYEVYLLEATYKDPVGCAARNVHGFTQRDIHKMADLWEEAPPLYMKLEIKSLLHGDDLEENGIKEVDMDTEDGGDVSTSSGSDDAKPVDFVRISNHNVAADGPAEDEQKWAASEEHSVEVVKELGKSKWSNILDEDDAEKGKIVRETSSAPTGLTESYSKKGKSVRWADKVGSIGFSIGAGKTRNVSLIIGPGSGYNLKSNPSLEEENPTRRSVESSKSRTIFQEQLRAESESFRAVFDKRRHRISRLQVDEV